MAEAHHAAVAHVEIHPANELAVGAGGDDDRFANQHGFRKRVVGMAREDDVDAADHAGHLLVDVETVVAEDDNEISPLGAHLVHHLLHSLVANAEGVFREHPARIRDRHVGEGLADDGDFRTAAVEPRIGREGFGRFVPFGIEDVLSQGREADLIDQFQHPVGAKCEFPVEGHGVGLEQAHGVHDILPLGLVAAVGAVPGVATVEQDRIRTRCADRLDHSRNPIEPAHAPVFAGKRREVVICQGVVRGTAVFDTVETPEIRASDVRHRALVVPYPEVDLGLAEIDRLQLGVDVRKVDQRDVSESLELKQLVLRQGLLRGQSCPIAETRTAVYRGCRHGGLQKIATRDHGSTFLTYSHS